MFNSSLIFDTYLTRNTLLESVTEEEIFEFYLKVPVKYRKLFSNPFRNDENPTCSFFIKEGNLLMKDHSGWFVGDCFSLVSKVYNLSYVETLHKIKEDLSLNINSPIKVTRVREETKPSSIRVKSREFKQIDLDYWKDFGITLEILKLFKVKAVENIWLNEQLIYNYSKSNPCYAYHFVDYEYKLYFPFPKFQKFLCNNNRLQGFQQLRQSKLCIITKSMKDVMTLYSLGYSSVAPPSENKLIDVQIINYLKEKYEHIVLLYDNDVTGRTWSEKNSIVYNLPQIFLKEAKDISDLRKLKGVEHTRKVLTNLIKATWHNYVKSQSLQLQELNLSNLFHKFKT